VGGADGHSQGVNVRQLNDGSLRASVQNSVVKHQGYVDTVTEHGYGHLPLLVDEWGFCTHGFFNRDECPELLSRETEMFSAYFAKLIYAFIEHNYNVDMLCICLSGQHEMTEDFSGFRNFFTLNFIAKPIYNAHILASRLHEELMKGETDRENLFVIATRSRSGAYAVLLTYASEYFEEELPTLTERLEFAEDLTGRKITLWAIDREHTNPYRLYTKLGIDTPNEAQLKQLRAEGRLKPVYEGICQGNTLPEINMTPNGLYLLTAE